MRILQINTAAVGGGAERVAASLHSLYSDQGHDAWLGVGWNSADTPGVFHIQNDRYRPRHAQVLARWADQLFSDSGEVNEAIGPLSGLLRRIGQPQRVLHRLRGIEDFEFPATWRLLDVTGDTPDVLHLHNLHGDYFDLRALPHMTRRVPTVLTLHDTWTFTGHCAYFVECDRWRSGCGSCPDLQRYPSVRRDATDVNWARKRTIYRRSDLRVGAPSQWLIDAARSSILAEAAREFRVIPHGIDLEVFHPGKGAQEARSKLGLPQEAQLLLFVANAATESAYKDPSTVVEAVQKLQLGDDGRPVVAFCVGSSGPTERSGSVTTQYVGYVHDDQVLADWYRAADLYLHAARAEAAGLTIAEALACGTPVVATGVGGVPEQLRGWRGAQHLHPQNGWVREGATGILVPARDPGAMAEAASRLLMDGDLRSLLSRNAVDLARHRFDQRVTRDAYLGWYLELVGALDGR